MNVPDVTVSVCVCPSPQFTTSCVPTGAEVVFDIWTVNPWFWSHPGTVALVPIDTVNTGWPTVMWVTLEDVPRFGSLMVRVAV
jgi:hypothetical protein